MSGELLRARSLDSLKKEAKRWLKSLRAGPPAERAVARARLVAVGHAPTHPTLRDVQFALAREHGFSGWNALTEAIERGQATTRAAGARALAHYEAAADALLNAYRTGSPDAMEIHYGYTWHRRPWQGMRTYVQLDLGMRAGPETPNADITLDDARYLVAVEHGFSTWEALREFAASSRPGLQVATRPVHLVERDASRPERTIMSSRSWDALVQALATHPSACLKAEGQMTDAVLASIVHTETITALDLSGSRGVTDEGLRVLSRLPHLEHLDLSGTGITDRGLDVLRDLPALRFLSLAMTRVTDAGAVQLGHCHALGHVDLTGTQTGDGAIRALAGKRNLHQFRSGDTVTDAGLSFLHDLPVFAIWHGGDVEMALLSYHAGPNQLFLRGSFTDRGMAHLRGLDGLFGLDIDDATLSLSAAALRPLISLPHLGWLAADAKDDWMPFIAEMPRLRFLGAQDTSAGDDGFVALSRSHSLEYIWGRRCHNLGRRGFMALAGMPALRGLSVSCLNVDDDGLAALPEFPALRELMPIDVPDAGYRHIGKCARLESLILMYCRQTTDAATERITGLSRLSSYFNSYTTITDRTPALLSGMESLERITFDACHGLTNAGIARLAVLPGLRELRVSGRGITPDVARGFGSSVRVYVGG